jgi:hypothetical protein
MIRIKGAEDRCVVNADDVGFAFGEIGGVSVNGVDAFCGDSYRGRCGGVFLPTFLPKSFMMNVSF